jgi:hypothetical protein
VVIQVNSMQHVGAPTVADGMTADHAAYIVATAREFHRIVAKVAELRRRDPEAAIMREIDRLAETGLSIDSQASARDGPG